MRRRPLELKVTVDPIVCDAYGYCAELLPELITLDEWGYPIVEGRPVPPELVELAKRAADACPRRALTLKGTRTALTRILPAPAGVRT